MLNPLPDKLTEPTRTNPSTVQSPEATEPFTSVPAESYSQPLPLIKAAHDKSLVGVLIPQALFQFVRVHMQRYQGGHNTQ
jgi:hypothetical protein